MDDLTSVILTALATWQTTEVINHSELSLPTRRWADKNAKAGILRSIFSKIINCPFCLSHWVAGAAVILFILALEQVPYCGWLEYLIWILATTRLANVGNDVTRGVTQTPKFYVNEEVEHDDIEVDDEPEDTDLRGKSGGPGETSDRTDLQGDA